MKRGYQTARIYRVRCRSGLMGWRARLRNIHKSLSSLESAERCYGFARRIGLREDSCKAMLKLWERNPIIEGSVNPSDLRRVE